MLHSPPSTAPGGDCQRPSLQQRLLLFPRLYYRQGREGEGSKNWLIQKILLIRRLV